MESYYVSILPIVVMENHTCMKWVVEDLKGQILVGGLYDFAYKYEHKLTVL